jgi:ParB family chromosome partitioning protein
MSQTKIAFSESRNIPFNKLILSQSNVRRVKSGLSIEELAEDIARRTLLQSLNVRPVRDAEGNETGMYEIPAGGRRYRALELLVKQKRMSKTQPIPCIVRDAGLAEEDSLAENVQRQALHPLDQFRAFQALIDKGLSEEDIAARFFVSANVVKQRLKLAAVSENLLQAYEDDEMSLEQLMAFTVTNDPKRQESVWASIQKSHRDAPYEIRRLLTEGSVRGGDKRAQFVGIEAYEAAGGTVLTDLFNQDDDGWFEDAPLLDGLAREKLAAEAQVIRAEGWKWIEAAIDFPYGYTAGMARISGSVVEMTEEEQAAYEALRAEYESLEAAYASADELPEDADERLAQIETTLEAFNDRPMSYNRADMARAGAFISIAGDGRLRIERGYVRPEDVAKPAPTTAHGAPSASIDAPSSDAPIIVHSMAPSDNDDIPERETRPSDRLVAELTAERTLALRNALAVDGSTALLAVLHALTLSRFYFGPAVSCLEIASESTRFSIQGPGLADSPSAKAIEARHSAWQERLPETPDELWQALTGFSDQDRFALLAHCAALTVNAVAQPWERRPARLAHADALARAVGLDMAAAGWTPTTDNYFGRVPKALILDAVREAKGDATAQLIDHLKKQDMAAEAERLLAGTGWLPEVLRTPDPLTDDLGEEETADEGAALPAFLHDAADVAADAVA